MMTTTRTKKEQTKQHRFASALSRRVSRWGISHALLAWGQRIEKLIAPLVAHWTHFKLSRPYPPMRAGESTGSFGERLAGDYLARKSYIVLERSFRASGGEIDIIAAWKKKTVVFVEVKTWVHSSVNQGGPSDRIDERKKRNITNTALRYLKQHHLLTTSARIDVIEVVLEPAPGVGPSFRHFENAFEATGRFQMFS